MMAHLERKHWGIIHKQVSENKPTPDVKKATGTSVSIGSSSTQIFDKSKIPLKRSSPRSIEIDKAIAEYYQRYEATFCC